jgi:hypothetical protein
MLSPLPRHSDWVPVSLTSPAVPAFPAWVDGSACATSFSRIAQRSLTLRPAHSPSHLVTLYTRGFSHFVTFMTAPIASGWSEICRVGLSPTGKRRLSTAHTQVRPSIRMPERQECRVGIIWRLLRITFRTEIAQNTSLFVSASKAKTSWNKGFGYFANVRPSRAAFLSFFSGIFIFSALA